MKKSSCSSTTVHLSFMVGGAAATRQAITLIKSIIYHMRAGFKCSNTETARPQTRLSNSSDKDDVILALHFVVDQAAHISLQSIFQSWQLPAVLYYFYDFEQFKENITWIPSRHYSGDFGCGKLLLAYILPADLEKVITLDVDLLLNADIRELWAYFDHFTPTNMIGMTTNQSPWYKTTTSLSVWPALDSGYNTGVMLLDLAKMRNAGWAKIWPSIARENIKIHKFVYLADQDIINAVIVQYPNFVHNLPCFWNLQLNSWNEPVRCEVQLTMQSATMTTTESGPNQQIVPSIKIAHFNSPQKPESLRPGQLPKDESIRMPGEKRYLRQLFIRRYHMFQEYDGRWIKDQMASLQSNDFLNNTLQYLIEPSNCTEFEANRQILRRIHPFYLTYDFTDETNEKLAQEVTLLSQLSFDRIHRLEQLVSNWPGPMSLALYLDEREAHMLPILVQQSNVLSKRRNIGFHIVFSEGPFYPINELRNVALKYARTKLVFHLDADFIPSPNLYRSIQEIVEKRRKKKETNASSGTDFINDNTGDAKDCFIVPAFETFDVRLPVPSTKQELLDTWDHELVVPFRHQIWTRGHLATNYTRWRNATELYQVQWSADYEPYVVTHRSVPALDPRFVGFGWNKASYIMVLDALGYRFFVLPDAFVLHLPHPPSMEVLRYRSSPEYRYCIDKMKLDFIKQLAKQYGVQALKYLEFRKEELD